MLAKSSRRARNTSSIATHHPATSSITYFFCHYTSDPDKIYKRNDRLPSALQQIGQEAPLCWPLGVRRHDVYTIGLQLLWTVKQARNRQIDKKKEKKEKKTQVLQCLFLYRRIRFITDRSFQYGSRGCMIFGSNSDSFCLRYHRDLLLIHLFMQFIIYIIYILITRIIHHSSILSLQLSFFSKEILRQTFSNAE